MSPTPLSALGQVIAHARMGALDQAWRLFRAAGLEGASDDAAVLSVKGRLFKDEARRAPDEASRRAFFARAAEAYGQAGAIAWATYPLINAASLSLLAGDEGRARALAEKVLARLDQGDHEPDTPYWREATRAEAELLLGRTHEAWLTLQGALALAPHAWEDHAATLRQFSLILAERGEDEAWLEPLRPPRVLHYAGRLGAAPDDPELQRRLADLLERERVGFAWGALAAGADILIAEALLARGAELSLVLPVSREAFRTASVAPLGGDWPARYDAVLARASQVTVSPGGTDPLTDQSAALAALAAMGRAVMQSRVLATEPLQLILDDGQAGADASPPAGSRWSAQTWRASGRRTVWLDTPAGPAPPAAALPSDDAARTLAVLAIDLSACGPPAMTLSRLTDRLAKAGAPAVLLAPVWTGTALALCFDSPDAALAAARTLSGVAGEAAFGAAFGIVRSAAGPAGSDLTLGPAVDHALRLAQAAGPGGMLAETGFAAALALASGPLDPLPCEPAGELPSPAGADPDADPSVFSLRLS